MHPAQPTSAKICDLRIVVIDEVHAMAGTDRGAHLMSVLERLAAVSQHDVQRVGLSATVGNPEDILRWLQGTSERPGRVVDPPKQPSKRELLVVHRPELAQLAEDAARMARGQKSLFFCQSRATTEKVAEHMRRAGTEVFVHQSAVSREERELAEERFQHGTDACIVCTSTLELGIDVGDLNRVLQAEAPDTVSSFLQRMGRTGRRAGQAANTTFFCETTEGVLQAVALTDLAKAGWVESVPSQARTSRWRRSATEGVCAAVALTRPDPLGRRPRRGYSESGQARRRPHPRGGGLRRARPSRARPAPPRIRPARSRFTTSAWTLPQNPTTPVRPLSTTPIWTPTGTRRQ